MSSDELYLMSQVVPMLAPGERVLFAAAMRKAPSLWLQALLLGAILQLIGTWLTKHYFVVLTHRRMILLQTTDLRGEEWDLRSILRVEVGGVHQNRSMTFFFTNAPKRVLRIAPGTTRVTGTKDFFEQVPALLNSGQLVHQAPLHPVQPAQPGPLPPGTQVVVTAPDGSRHYATIVQEQQGHYLCSGPAGQGWVPAHHVTRV
jgi:hypothetical protein